MGRTHQKPENLVKSSSSVDSESTASGSLASCSKSAESRLLFRDIKDGARISISKGGDDSLVIGSFPERTQAGELFSAALVGRHLHQLYSNLQRQYVEASLYAFLKYVLVTQILILFCSSSSVKRICFLQRLEVMVVLSSMDLQGIEFGPLLDTDPPPFPTISASKDFIDLLLEPTEEDMKIWPHSFE